MCGNVDNVLCYFSKCDPLVRFKLIRAYCSDLYGSVLWDMSHSSIDNVCIAWRKCLKTCFELTLAYSFGLAGGCYWSVATYG